MLWIAKFSQCDVVMISVLDGTKNYSVLYWRSNYGVVNFFKSGMSINLCVLLYRQVLYVSQSIWHKNQFSICTIAPSDGIKPVSQEKITMLKKSFGIKPSKYLWHKNQSHIRNETQVAKLIFMRYTRRRQILTSESQRRVWLVSSFQRNKF